jgi:hypothetical protein
MGIEVFPPGLLFKDKWDEVVTLLITLPIPERRKKELVVEWAKVVGAVLTEEMIREVLGGKAREV